MSVSLCWDCMRVINCCVCVYSVSVTESSSSSSMVERQWWLPADSGVKPTRGECETAYYTAVAYTYSYLPTF